MMWKVFSAAKVADFQLFILTIGNVNKNVFGFDIPVCNSEFVKARQPWEKLVHQMFDLQNSSWIGDMRILARSLVVLAEVSLHKVSN